MKTVEIIAENDSLEFDKWVDSLPSKHWAKYDLSACCLGFNAGRASIRAEFDRMEEVYRQEVKALRDTISKLSGQA
jgi:hypothetical protein